MFVPLGSSRLVLVSSVHACALMEPSDLCDWWARYGHLIPSLELLARDLASMCPSSAAAESVFSILRQMFTPQQLSVLEETVEGSTMLRHNSRNAKWPVSEVRSKKIMFRSRSAENGQKLAESSRITLWSRPKLILLLAELYRKPDMQTSRIGMGRNKNTT